MDKALRAWENNWTPFSDTERADLRRELAAAVGEGYTRRTIGERIESARSKRGWTQAELGAYVGSGVAQVCRWERNKIRPNSDKLMALSKVLEVPLAIPE